MRKAVAVALIGVLVVTGCGGGGDDSAAPTTTEAAVTTTSPTTTTTDPEVTLRRYASRLGPTLVKIPDAYDELSYCLLDKITDSGDCAFRWELGVMGAGTMSETLMVASEGLAEEGDPPAEIEDLLDDTLDQSALVVDAVEAYTDAECDYSTDTMECAGLTGDIMAPFGQLASLSEQWAPYL